MCTTCGCSDGARATLTDLQTGHRAVLGDTSNHHHDHSHNHAHDHHHSHGHAHDAPPEHSPLLLSHPGRTIQIERDLLARNNLMAERNRGWFAGRNILALNLISAPGAGKTTLLERTIADMAGELTISVVEGDQATLNDSDRIRATGARVVQINTGTGCHLEADMTWRGLASLNPPPLSIVMIENVGNLVCPALFDLGEHAKVVIAAVTEGEDKPIKYPHIYRSATLVILNKIDLLSHVRFDMDQFSSYVRQVNPRASILPLSATGREGLDAWYGWLRQQRAAEGFPLAAAL
jgi:hydrogenase nickel incorporation protein HypB